MSRYIKDPRSFAFGIIALMAIASGIFIWKTEERKALKRYEYEFLIIRPCMVQNSNDEDYLKCVGDKKKNRGY